MINHNYVHIIQPHVKFIPNCDVSLANGKLHQACGHATLLMNTVKIAYADRFSQLEDTTTHIESIHIRKVNCMNRDGGAYNLPTTMTVFWSRVDFAFGCVI